MIVCGSTTLQCSTCFVNSCAHLVQCGLSDRVVLDLERVLVFGEDGEDVCERCERRGQLVLQHVAVFLLQRAAAQLALDELHDGQQVWVGPRHPQDDGVAVPEPEAQTRSEQLSGQQLQGVFRPETLCASYLFFRCWTLPKHLNLPFTMMAILVHRASHSSILRHTDERRRTQIQIQDRRSSDLQEFRLTCER